MGVAIVGVVKFGVTIRGVDGAEIDAGMLTAPLRAGVKDGKLQVEPADLRAAFAEALDTAEERGPELHQPNGELTMADETRSGPEPDTRADRSDCPNPIHLTPQGSPVL